MRYYQLGPLKRERQAGMFVYTSPTRRVSNSQRRNCPAPDGNSFQPFGLIYPDGLEFIQVGTLSKVPEKIDLMRVAQELGDREERTVSNVESLNVYVTSYLGEYPAHKHPKAEFFLILDGELELDFSGRSVVLHKGEGLKVPQETVHKPFAKSRALVMKIEPAEFPFERV